MLTHNARPRLVSIQPDSASPAVRALFDADMPAGARCFATLDGIHKGTILTDDPDNPTWAVVKDAAYGTVYFGGALKASAIYDLIMEFRPESDVLIGVWRDDPLLKKLPPSPDYDGWTVDFTDRPAGDGLDHLLTRTPDDCEIRVIDRELFERCSWRQHYITQFGSAGAFLNKGLGFCLMKDGEIVSEVYSASCGGRIMEMGVTTQEAHRRRGYATYLCAYTIRECEQRGYTTYWNSARQNGASIALARKLGYQSEREYRLLAWFRLK